MSIDKEKLKALADGADAGPWVVHADGMEQGSPVRTTNPGIDTADGQVICWWGTGLCGIPHNPNAEYIAAANPSTVLALLDEIQDLRMLVKEMDLMFGRYLLGMRASVVEWQKGKGADAAMQWIWNGLRGPGELPPEEETQAQAYFDREVVKIEEGLEEVYAYRDKRRAEKDKERGQ